MEKVQEAIQHFVPRTGHHDTTLDKTVASAAVDEQGQSDERGPHLYNSGLQSQNLKADQHLHSHIPSQMTSTSPHDTNTARPHSSDFGKQPDPRIDNDLSGRHDVPGTSHCGNTTTMTETGLTHDTTSTNTTAGAHDDDASLRDKLDPRVDTDTSHTGSANTHHGSSTQSYNLGAGTAANPKPGITPASSGATGPGAGTVDAEGKVGSIMDHTRVGSTGVDRQPSTAGTNMTAEQRDEKKSGFPYMNVLK